MDPSHLENCARIVAFASDFAENPLSKDNRVPSPQLHHQALATLVLIKGSYPSLKASIPCREMVIGLVAAVARKLMQGRQAARYL
jgi:hypothetical protein